MFTYTILRKCMKNFRIFLFSILFMFIFVPITTHSYEVSQRSEIDYAIGDKYVNIKKVLNDNTGQDVNKVSFTEAGVNLPDGTYLLNRGHGWVLEEDKSLITTAFGVGGQAISISHHDTQTNSVTHQVVSYTELTLPGFKIGLQKIFGKGITESKSIGVNYSFSVDDNMSLFSKVYGIYGRYDMIRVSNNKVVEVLSSYEPEGSWINNILYSPGSLVDQDALIYDEPISVLLEPEKIQANNQRAIIHDELGGEQVEENEDGFDDTDY